MTTTAHRIQERPLENGTGPDWADFARRYWDRQPAVVRAASPVDEDQVHALTVQSCAPFRAGTRYWVMPDVRLLVGDGWLRAPGTLLPDTTDTTMDAYLDRLDADVSGRGFLLAVRQPLLLDYAMWSAVRDAASGLWRAVGWPNLPVVTEILIGDRFTQHTGAAEAPTHASLTWVLRGRLDVRLWDESGGPPPVGIADPETAPTRVRTLSAGPGDLLYWPGDQRHVDTYRERGVALRLRVPVDRHLPFTALRDFLAELVHSRQDNDETVPYFPFGPDTRFDEPGGVLPRLTWIGDELRTLVESEQLRRTLRVRWAALRSAAGLEPIPAPREGPALTTRSRIRRSAEIVRMPDGSGREVWAVNGNVFALPAAAGDRVFAALGGGEEVTVAEVCRALAPEGGGTGAHEKNTLDLLNRLYRLRGIDAAADAEEFAR